MLNSRRAVSTSRLGDVDVETSSQLVAMARLVMGGGDMATGSITRRIELTSNVRAALAVLAPEGERLVEVELVQAEAPAGPDASLTLTARFDGKSREVTVVLRHDELESLITALLQGEAVAVAHLALGAKLVTVNAEPVPLQPRRR
jgi:hypothetical protein